MHLVVVGAGVFGAWIARHAVVTGARVTLVDAYGPGNSRSSSGDESRIIRCGYGPDEIYSRWARESLTQWAEVLGPMASPLPILHRSGVLWLTDDLERAAATHDTLTRLAYPIEKLGPAELRARFPQFTAADLPLGLFEPDAGVLMARRAVQTLVGQLERHGVSVVRALVEPPAGTGELEAVRTSRGDLPGDCFVFACGPWLPKVFPPLLHDRIRPTRQVVVYLATPAGTDLYGPERMPAWIDYPIYGVPDLEHRGVKVGVDRHGPPFDPDSDDRLVDAATIAEVRAWLARRMPALAHAPIAEARVCQYENTDNGDFLIDRHPDFSNVWIAGGGSGHGFKHGPAVGRHVAGLVRGTAASEPRFALASRGTVPRRAIF